MVATDQDPEICEVLTRLEPRHAQARVSANILFRILILKLKIKTVPCGCLTSIIVQAKDLLERIKNMNGTDLSTKEGPQMD